MTILYRLGRVDQGKSLLTNFVGKEESCTIQAETTKPLLAPRSLRASITRVPTSSAPVWARLPQLATWCAMRKCPEATSISSKRTPLRAAPAMALTSPAWAMSCAAAARWTIILRSCGISSAPFPQLKIRTSPYSTSITGSTRRTPTTRCAAQPRIAAKTAAPMASSACRTRRQPRSWTCSLRPTRSWRIVPSPISLTTRCSTRTSGCTGAPCSPLRTGTRRSR